VTAIWRPARWPLAVKVPLLFATLMVVVAAGISKAVLYRLYTAQQAHFGEVNATYLEGLATALQPTLVRRDPWEAFDILDRAKARYQSVQARVTLVITPDGRVLASSDPMAYPISSEPPGSLMAAPSVPDFDKPTGVVWIRRELQEAGIPLGTVAALVDISRFQAVRRETLVTLVGFNVILTVLLAALGWFLVRRALQPLTRLSDLLGRSADGRLPTISDAELPAPDTEAGRAYRRYNAAAQSVEEREVLLTRLAAEERAALIGRYASAMAHEVNNPLGGLFNAVRMIQRHGDDPLHRERAARLIERGLTGIQNVVKASLVLWRSSGDDGMVTRADIEDLRFLVASEAERRELTLNWENDVAHGMAVPAHPVRQIALNLLLNACAASPAGSTVTFRAHDRDNALHLEITDQGAGMPDEPRRLLLEGAEAPLPIASGLGIWTVSRLIAEMRAKIAVSSGPGTHIIIKLPSDINERHLASVA
jgi:signal transduction histidine kinase